MQEPITDIEARIDARIDNFDETLVTNTLMLLVDACDLQAVLQENARLRLRVDELLVHNNKLRSQLQQRESN